VRRDRVDDARLAAAARHGADCADVIRRTVYNGILPLSLDGTSFFYVNPLQRRTHRTWTGPGDGERAPWYACACTRRT
jgi:DUF1680 family protein